MHGVLLTEAATGTAASWLQPEPVGRETRGALTRCTEGASTSRPHALSPSGPTVCARAGARALF